MNKYQARKYIADKMRKKSTWASIGLLVCVGAAFFGIDLDVQEAQEQAQMIGGVVAGAE